ncbi:DoxX-like family protein [Sphingobacterium hotanense]|uniref:DoxX-like family protein n=1 Tax=Sphingobacterium hotanense TaxID=649196 RepID=A0ABT7NSW6_9SPHI|nr:DoxX-like family protein [Sphingobacterium hotanense]MDM1050048.1 DoxX-like family protein [Sphingobacterium hotanense]
MKSLPIYSILQGLIALVWLINGLLCKILNLVPRHQQIVERILGEPHARLLTILIGIAEIMMVVLILSRWNTRLCAITQIVVIGVMNIIELILAEDLLLWGRLNIVFAFAFMVLIYLNEFRLKPTKNNSSS